MGTFKYVNFCTIESERSDNGLSHTLGKTCHVYVKLLFLFSVPIRPKQLWNCTLRPWHNFGASGHDYKTRADIVVCRGTIIFDCTIIFVLSYFFDGSSNSGGRAYKPITSDRPHIILLCIIIYIKLLTLFSSFSVMILTSRISLLYYSPEW